jgi:hypothetical protein
MLLAMKTAALSLVAVALGLSIAYMDSRPHFDDAGVTVAALTVGAVMLGMIGPERPWLWALGVGVWIPIQGIVLKHDFTMLIVLLFPLAGAYIGRLVRTLA